MVNLLFLEILMETNGDLQLLVQDIIAIVVNFSIIKIPSKGNLGQFLNLKNNVLNLSFRIFGRVFQKKFKIQIKHVILNLFNYNA